MRADQSPLKIRRVLLIGAVSVTAALLCAGPVGATIQEQRARLPPPAHCEDPVEGIWRAHKYNPRFSDWIIFTLEIHRVPGSHNELRGTILSEGWEGGPSDQEPGPCTGRWHWIVSMDARGVSEGDHIVFGEVNQ